MYWYLFSYTYNWYGGMWYIMKVFNAQNRLCHSLVDHEKTQSIHLYIYIYSLNIYHFAPHTYATSLYLLIHYSHIFIDRIFTSIAVFIIILLELT